MHAMHVHEDGRKSVGASVARVEVVRTLRGVGVDVEKVSVDLDMHNNNKQQQTTTTTTTTTIANRKQT